jgi:predicted esterase
MRLSTLVLATVLITSASALAQDRYPPGRSTQTLGGIRYEMLVPTEAQGKDGYSLLVILHGNGGTATGMVGVGQQDALEQGFITCAPKSTGTGWSLPDIKVVQKITQHLIDMYDVAIHRRHAGGFSNGGYNLVPLAFDEKLHFRTACWIASSFGGGKPPRWAVKEMGCLALVGAEDGACPSAIKIVDQLGKKVKFVDYRVQPGLGHKLPREHIPYWFYVMEVMEGRFTAGRQFSYAWKKDLTAARQEMAEKKIGGFVYIYDPDGDEKERALTKAYQNTVLFDRVAGFFGRQLVPVMLEKSAAADLIAEAKVKSTPAIVVFKRGGEKTAKVLTGKLSAKKLASALRSQAKNKSLPD